MKIKKTLILKGPQYLWENGLTNGGPLLVETNQGVPVSRLCHLYREHMWHNCLNLEIFAWKAGMQVVSLLPNVKAAAWHSNCSWHRPMTIGRTSLRVELPSSRQSRDIRRQWLGCFKAHLISRVLVTWPVILLVFFFFLRQFELGYFKGGKVAHFPRTVQVYACWPGIIISNASF